MAASGGADTGGVGARLGIAGRPTPRRGKEKPVMPNGKPLKILHLISQRPDATGSGIYLQAMLRESAARGHRNFLVAGIQSDRPASLDCIPPEHCRYVAFGGADIAFEIVGMSDVMPYPSRRFSDLSEVELDAYEAAFARVLDRAVSEFEPDIVHSHHLWLLSSLARRRLVHRPVVTTCHGTDLRQFQNNPHLRPRVLAGCRRIDAAMALSEAQKTEIAALYGLPEDRIAVAGAGYNDTLFAPRPKAAPPPVRLLYAGKLCNAKGVPWLLGALETLQHLEWELHLAGGGSGPEKECCLALARALGERARVHGPLPQTRLADLMAASHVFILSSLFEGLPLVVLEALACGCRVVATKLPGVEAIFAGERIDRVSLIDMPRMQTIDQPLPDAEAGFQARMAQALEAQILAAAETPQIDMTPISALLARFTWNGVFDKVQAVYHRVLKFDRPQAAGLGSGGATQKAEGRR
jgi:glycosyltransferase involved in cell wall biosynthesis